MEVKMLRAPPETWSLGAKHRYPETLKMKLGSWKSTGVLLCVCADVRKKYFAQFMTTREKQILARCFGFQKKQIVSNHVFYEIIKQS